MKRVIQFALEDGSPFFLEIQDTDETQGPVRVGGEQDTMAAKVVGGLDKALAHLKPATQALVKAIREANTPAEISLEFSLSFSTKVGAFILTGDSEAALKGWSEVEEPASGWLRRMKLQGRPLHPGPSLSLKSRYACGRRAW